MNTESFVTEFAEKLRNQAAGLSKYGAREASTALLQAAEELEAEFQRWWLQELSVSESATESGYSEERLREMVREGKLPDNRSNGSRGPIVVRRCDLPNKPAGGRAAGDIDIIAERLLGASRN